MQKGIPLFILSIVTCLIPTAAYFIVIELFAINIPWSDDYIFFLDPLNKEGNVLAEIFRLHGTYRLLFQKVIAYLTHFVSGEFNFRFLVFFGNSALIFIAIIFIKTRDRKFSIWAIPIFFLLFNLKYFESTFWALTSIVAHWTALWALLTFYLLSIFIKKEKNIYYFLAILTGFIATFSFGNGFFVLLVSLILLIKKKEHFFIWLFISLIFIVSYFYGYSSQGGSSLSSLILEHPLDVMKSFLALIGTLFYIGSAGIYFSIIAGLGFSIYFLFLTFRFHYFKINPANYGMMLFLLLTALAIGLGRTVPGSEIPYPLFKSRYAFWITLLMITFYIASIDIINKKGRKVLIQLSIVLSIVYAYYTYRSYLEFIEDLKQNLISGIIEYKLDPTTGLLRTVGSNQRINPILTKSLEKGIYSIPALDYSLVESKKLERVNRQLDYEILDLLDSDSGVVDNYLIIRGNLGDIEIKENQIYLQFIQDDASLVYYTVRPVSNNTYSNELDVIAIISLDRITNKGFTFNFIYSSKVNG